MTHQTLFAITSAVAAEKLFSGSTAVAYHNLLVICLCIAGVILLVRDA